MCVCVCIHAYIFFSFNNRVPAVRKIFFCQISTRVYTCTYMYMYSYMGT